MDEARLTDPGLADDRDELSLPFPGTLEKTLQEPELGVTPHELRRCQQAIGRSSSDQSKIDAALLEAGGNLELASEERRRRLGHGYAVDAGLVQLIEATPGFPLGILIEDDGA